MVHNKSFCFVSKLFAGLADKTTFLVKTVAFCATIAASTIHSSQFQERMILLEGLTENSKDKLQLSLDSLSQHIEEEYLISDQLNYNLEKTHEVLSEHYSQQQQQDQKSLNRLIELYNNFLESSKQKIHHAELLEINYDYLSELYQQLNEDKLAQAYIQDHAELLALILSLQCNENKILQKSLNQLSKQIANLKKLQIISDSLVATKVEEILYTVHDEKILSYGILQNALETAQMENESLRKRVEAQDNLIRHYEHEIEKLQ